MKLQLFLPVFVTSLLILSACEPTKEEKAQKMAANHLKGVLYHYDNYEPIHTKVDSSFIDLSTDTEAIGLAVNMLKLFQSLQECIIITEQAERSMEVWQQSPYSSALERGEYKRAKEKYDASQNKIDKTKEQIQNLFSKIKNRQSELNGGSFNGWRVSHRFKSSNDANTVDPFGEYIFFCDENFNETAAYTKEEYDAIAKVLTAISYSENIVEMVEKIQNEMY